MKEREMVRTECSMIAAEIIALAIESKHSGIFVEWVSHTGAICVRLHKGGWVEYDKPDMHRVSLNSADSLVNMAKLRDKVVSFIDSEKGVA